MLLLIGGGALVWLWRLMLLVGRHCSRRQRLMIDAAAGAGRRDELLLRVMMVRLGDAGVESGGVSATASGRYGLLL